MRATDYELLFDLPVGEYNGAGVDGVRTKTYRAGRSLEVMVYPRTKLTQEARREAARRRSRPSMARINARNRELQHMRILEANFTARAQVVMLSYAYPVEDYGMCDLKELSEYYDANGLPWEVETVQRHKRNFLAKLKRRVIAAGGNADDLKWDITIEEGKEPAGVGLPAKFHMHCVIEGPGISRETVEACWTFGRTHCDPFDMANDGPKRLAAYLNKQRHPGRWWSHSRNLTIPRPNVSDRKVSRRRLSLLAADVKKNGAEIFAKLYPGYKLVEEPVVTFSDFVTGAYVYARMRRRD